MSELIHKNDSHKTIHWKLLTGASAMALMAYVASTALAKADDADRPQLWIELGGQLDIMQGLSSTFTAPFMYNAPAPISYYKGDTLLQQVTPSVNVYGASPIEAQRAPRFGLGGDGKVSFQSEDSDWIFSVAMRYGRVHGNRHVHHQTSGQSVPVYTYPGHSEYERYVFPLAPFMDATRLSSERHFAIDFTAGKDIGIGLFGRDGKSTVNAGLRVFDITESSSTVIYARPSMNFHYPAPKYQLPQVTFDVYSFKAHAARSFRGVGPSLSWNASAAIAGNEQDGELTVDWAVNAALLFGRQKAKTQHSTLATYYNGTDKYNPGYAGPIYPAKSANSSRSRKVTVPNLGGSVGLSVNYPNFKFSVGYRADAFLHAMDIGIDARKTSNLTFNGPYASISIGLGN